MIGVQTNGCNPFQTAKRLARAGHIDELRRCADAGDVHAARQLAIWLARADRLDELRDRMAAGDQFARRAYSDWLVRRRRIPEAVDVLRPLASLGLRSAQQRLARLLAGLGHLEQAMAVLAQAPPESVDWLRMEGWFAARGLIDRRGGRAGVRHEYLGALRRKVSAGDADARLQLSWIVLLWWHPFEPRLADAAALLADIGSNDWLHERLVHMSRGWWRGEFRAAAIDALASAEVKAYHRTRAALLMLQNHREAAISQLRSLSADGDQYAQRDLTAILDAESPRQEIKAGDQPNPIFMYGIVFSPNGTALAAWGNSTSGSAQAVVWDADSGAQQYVQNLSGRWPRSVTFRPDGTLHELPDGSSGRLVTAPDGSVRAVRAGERLRLHSTVTDAVIREIPAPAGRTMEFHPDSTLLATSSDTTGVHVWHTATGALIRTIATSAQALAFSPDGTTLATADLYDGAIRLWSLNR
ncbi:WD40 repeat domain-containing protein [Nocardia tengchongensis]